MIKKVLLIIFFILIAMCAVLLPQIVYIRYNKHRTFTGKFTDTSGSIYFFGSGNDLISSLILEGDEVSHVSFSVKGRIEEFISVDAIGEYALKEVIPVSKNGNEINFDGGYLFFQGDLKDRKLHISYSGNSAKSQGDNASIKLFYDKKQIKLPMTTKEIGEIFTGKTFSVTDKEKVFDKLKKSQTPCTFVWSNISNRVRVVK